MGTNRQAFDRYVNGEKDALDGMPMQKQARISELCEVRDRFLLMFPEERYDFDVALTCQQKSLMGKYDAAIESLDPVALRNILNERASYDAGIRSLARDSFNSWITDERGNKYDERLSWRTRLEHTLDTYRGELASCDDMLARRVEDLCEWASCKALVMFPGIWMYGASQDEQDKMSRLAKLLLLCLFFRSAEMQLANGVLLARKKNNSATAIARAIETDAETVARMEKKYQTFRENAQAVGGNFLTAQAPMRTAQAQRKLFDERRNKPEYAFVAYLLAHQQELTDILMTVTREFLTSVNYCSYALAIRDTSDRPDHPVNPYLFKLRITHNFLNQYDHMIAPAYKKLHNLHVRDDLIQCVLYEGRKEFKKRVSSRRGA